MGTAVRHRVSLALFAGHGYPVAQLIMTPPGDGFAAPGHLIDPANPGQRAILETMATHDGPVKANWYRKDAHHAGGWSWGAMAREAARRLREEGLPATSRRVPSPFPECPSGGSHFTAAAGKKGLPFAAGYAIIHLHRGVEQLVARRAHNPKVAGSSPAPATMPI